MEDWKRYDREEREYESDLRKYRSDRNAYERELADWKVRDQARRANLNALNAQLSQAFNAALASLKAQQEKVKEVNTKVFEEQRQLRDLRRQVDLADVLASQLGKRPTQMEDLQKPSLYPLLDYSRESTRLSKMVSTRP